MRKNYNFKKVFIILQSFLIFLTCLRATLAWSVPQVISYQGILKDADGYPLAGLVSMTFRIYDDETSIVPSNLLWSEDHTNVPLDNGIYHVQIGSNTVFPSDIFLQDNLWLEVEVETEVLTPRIKFTSAAFSFHAATADAADTVDGQHASSFASSTHNHNSIYYSKAEVDTLISAITTAYESRISALEAKLTGVTVVENTVVFSGVNVQIKSGSGATDGEVNGLGNLIVGYNENSGQTRTGSHNLIVGPYHTYTRYGGLVVGKQNSITGNYASVSVGTLNNASGDYSSVSGGGGNTASGLAASISGGGANTASNTTASVSGGEHNIASGIGASISGGDYNTASSTHSSVSGGENNTASGVVSSVCGGARNIASGPASSVSGGRDNESSGEYSSVSGGENNTASAALYPEIMRDFCVSMLYTFQHGSTKSD